MNLSDFLPFASLSSQQSSQQGRPSAVVAPAETLRSSPTYAKQCAPRPLLVRDAPNPFDDGKPQNVCTLTPSTSSPPSLADQLLFAVQAVLATSTHTFAETESRMVSAFEQLRKIIVHVAQMPADETRELLDGQSEHAVAVLTFLVEIVSGRPLMRSSQVCEVLNILLQQRSWQKAARSCPALLEKVGHNSTPPQVQACFEKIPQAKRSIGQRAKQRMQRWMICGCGQKPGKGISSPARTMQTAGVAGGA